MSCQYCSAAFSSPNLCVWFCAHVLCLWLTMSHKLAQTSRIDGNLQAAGSLRDICIHRYNCKAACKIALQGSLQNRQHEAQQQVPAGSSNYNGPRSSVLDMPCHESPNSRMFSKIVSGLTRALEVIQLQAGEGVGISEPKVIDQDQCFGPAYPAISSAKHPRRCLVPCRSSLNCGENFVTIWHRCCTHWVPDSWVALQRYVDQSCRRGHCRH